MSNDNITYGGNSEPVASVSARLHERIRDYVKDTTKHRVPDNEDYLPDLSVMNVIINGANETKHVRQVQWFLENDQWEDHVISTCEVKNCITHLALENVISDDELLALVQKDTRVSLADLYRKGRQKGLISARSSGY